MYIHKDCKKRYLPKKKKNNTQGALTTLTVPDLLQASNFQTSNHQSSVPKPPNVSKMCRMLTNSDLFGFRYGKIFGQLSQTFSQRTTLIRNIQKYKIMKMCSLISTKYILRPKNQNNSDRSVRFKDFPSHCVSTSYKSHNSEIAN